MILSKIEHILIRSKLLIYNVPFCFKSKSSLSKNQQYCRNNVRKHDYENYLCSLLLPVENRDFSFALRAFNVELAIVKDSVRDEKIAQMRFQFWKEAVDSALEGNPRNTPVISELAKNRSFSNLSKRWLNNMIDARLSHFNEKPFSNVQAVENYAEFVNSSIHYLLAESMQASNTHLEHALSHLGKAQGIVNLLRGVPYMARNQKVLLPHELMLKHGISQEMVLRGRGSDPRLTELTYEFASISSQHLDTCASIIKTNNFERPIKTIFLPMVTCRTYLERLQKADFNLFTPQLIQRDGLLPIRLWWIKFKGNPG